MDVTGAEALRRRIEKQAALQKHAGPGSDAPAETEQPADRGDGKAEGRKAVPVRPLLSRWIEPTSLPTDEPSLVSEAIPDAEPNGGGAGALNRRLAERRAQQTTGAPHATDAPTGESEHDGDADAPNRRRAERRARHTTVAPRKSKNPAVEAVVEALERPETTVRTDEPAHVVTPFVVEAPVEDAAEAETMIIQPSPSVERPAAPSEPALGDPGPPVGPRPDLRTMQRRQLEADRRRQAGLAVHATPAAPRTHSRFPHLPTVAFSVALSVAAALAVAIAFTRTGDGTPVAVGTTITVTRNPVTPTPAAQPRVVRLQALASYNPYGTGPEHSDLASRATDRDPKTFWSTETYGVNGFQKPGTGLVFAAPGVVSIAKLEVETDTPGFEAQVRVSESADGRFVPDSGWQTVQETSVFALQGKSGRYWVLWLRLPGHAGIAHVNEIRTLT